MTYDEAQLISESQRGDVQAFNLLVERYQTRVYNLAYRMLGDADLAADVAQDTFLSAYRNIRRYRGGVFAAWLLRIATNACYDVLRARQRRPTTSINALLEDEERAPRQFEDPGEAPDERSLRNELADEIQRALGMLDADQRLAIILSDIQGYSYDEISAVTGWPLGTVKSRLSRGRAHLRAILRQGELLPARFRQEDRT
ncbi:sigma-70 family RNA polymerase sigma factor [Kallotenue papyrolyticum]|uniref:sigma-70 family RNA polymerase sigma factor n=1 Tax=Kallotenue papyrolyticum TaxID=1325125 RepID=UPI0004785F79|nr:sigma-70 family RNA polymerase sigma factor [Kallotenue papyrolyticum]